MRAPLCKLFAVLPLLVAAGGPAWAQYPFGPAPSPKGKSGPFDEDREILKKIRNAYQAIHEVPQDVLKDLRKSYQLPSEKREASMLRDIRRLYIVNEQQELAILREIRKAYELQSVEQEQRIFREIEKAQRLPEGVVSPTIQSEQAEKLFRKLDVNDDSVLSLEEMPEPLRNERRRWDRNGDGSIQPDEYWAYYRRRIDVLSDDVAAGRIDLGLKRAGPVLPMTVEEDNERPRVLRAGKLPKELPAWFDELDTDRDGQVALFEWRRAGKALAEFAEIDRNDDGFITPEEALRFAANHETTAAGPKTLRKPMQNPK